MKYFLQIFFMAILNMITRCVPFFLYVVRWILNIIHTFESFFSILWIGIVELLSTDYIVLWSIEKNISRAPLRRRRRRQRATHHSLLLLLLPSWVPMCVCVCVCLMMVSKMQMWINSFSYTHIHTFSSILIVLFS